MHKILITGSRDWFPSAQITDDLEALIDIHGRSNIVVIHGGARGVDDTADAIARSLGIHTARVDALWTEYNKAAGPIRNKVMLSLEPDECFAYSGNLAESKGTANMIELATRAGITVNVREG